MSRYIAFLRGINVGGRNSVKMRDLLQLFLSLGFTDVKSYIQSGNVIFDSDQIDVSIKSILEQEFENRFGFATKVILRDHSQILKIKSDSPFPEKFHKDMSVVFFSQEFENDMVAEKLEEVKRENEQFFIVGRELFLIAPDGLHKSKFTNDLLEKLSGAQTTARNWRTICRVEELLTK